MVNETKKTKIATISFMICILFLSNCGCIGDEESNGEDVLDLFYYHLQLKYSGESSSILFFPIPITRSDGELEDDVLSDLVNDCTIDDGNEDVETISTEKGVALKVLIKCDVIIEGFKEFNRSDREDLMDYSFSDLSMKDEQNEDRYYIYYHNADNTTTTVLKFECYWETHPSTDEVLKWKLENVELENGWTSHEFNY